MAMDFFTNCHTMDQRVDLKLYPSVSIYIFCSRLEDLKNLQSRPPVDHEQRGITTGDDPVESSCFFFLNWLVFKGIPRPDDDIPTTMTGEFV